MEKEELTKIVGPENVLDDSGVLEIYSKDQSFVAQRRPKMVVKPHSGSEVQKVVKWANQSGTPLVPISSGPPHFRGDTIPSLGGTVIVDLSGMNRIIRIDRRNKMLMVEPGVTFNQVIPELTKNGLRIPMPLLPRMQKSVVGSLLEREPITIPKYQWHMPDPLRCLNVIWGSGDELRTGDAGGHGELEEQWKMNLAQVCGLGPVQTDYFRLLLAGQGTIGIATWASVKCELLPKLQKLLFVQSNTLDELIRFAYRVLKFRYGDEIFFMNNMYLASIFGDKPELIDSLKNQIPRWVLTICISGDGLFPEDKLKVQEQDVKAMAQQFGLGFTPSISGVKEGQILDAMKQCSRDPYWKLGYKGGCQDIFFLTTLDKTPKFITTMNAVAESKGYPASDIGIYLQPMMQGVACHCEFSLPYNPLNSTDSAKMEELFDEGSRVLLQNGAFFSRPYGLWSDLAFGRDAQQTIALRKIKGIFDPNNVLNPGKLCF